MEQTTKILIPVAFAALTGLVVDLSTSDTSANTSAEFSSTTPTETPTAVPDVPEWVLALPTIPVSQQVQTTPEIWIAPPKILPTCTATPAPEE